MPACGRMWEYSILEQCAQRRISHSSECRTWLPNEVRTHYLMFSVSLRSFEKHAVSEKHAVCEKHAVGKKFLFDKMDQQLATCWC